MKKVLLVPVMNRILILFAVVSLIMACSKGDESGNTDEGSEETEVEVETIDSLSEEEEVDALPDIVELAELAELSLFREALEKTDLAIKLNGDGPFTVFAPTDAAVQQLFVTLGDEYNSFDDFKNLVELQILNEILLGHVVDGKVAFEDFEAGTLPTLLPNDFIELIAKDDTFVIKDASQILTNFVSLDLETSNGTVHTIDKILIPQKVLAFVE